MTCLCLVSILLSPVSSFDSTLLEGNHHTILLPAENIQSVTLWEKPKNNEKGPTLEISSAYFTVETVSYSITAQSVLFHPTDAQRLSTLLLQTQHASTSL
ncbi:MAG: hypothetical protein HY960_00075 [Ignavibacteriae bacterium]|nr:hypothetical protein [Ignavibacteriota bacterium]